MFIAIFEMLYSLDVISVLNSLNKIINIIIRGVPEGNKFCCC